MKVKTVCEMDSSEFDELVKKHYPLAKFDSFICDQEYGNDSSHSFNGIGIPAKYGPDIPLEKIKLWRDAQLEAFENWKSGNPKDIKYMDSHMARDILEGLCREGHLQPGDYLIKVCW